MQLSENPTEMREIFKNFLREHAKQFSMSDWISGGYSNIPTLEKFEECGTSCCIGGALSVVFQDKAGIYKCQTHLPKIGISENADEWLFYRSEWPHKLNEEYERATDTEDVDFVAAVEAACKAIDWAAEWYPVVV